MERWRAVVLEMRAGRARVLDEHGRFRDVVPADPGWSEGAEVWVADPRAARAVRFAVRPRFRWVASAALAVVLALALVPAISDWQANAQVLGYVSVDINPAVRLAVNHHLDVVRATALDADGRRLLSQVPVAGEPVVTAVEDLVARAVTDGFVQASQPGAVVIAAIPALPEMQAPPPAVEAAAASASQHAYTVLRSHGISAPVVHLGAGSKDVAAARKLGLSIGKYAVWHQAGLMHLRVTPEELRHLDIVRALIASGVAPADIPSVLGHIGVLVHGTVARTKRGVRGDPASEGRAGVAPREGGSAQVPARQSGQPPAGRPDHGSRGRPARRDGASNGSHRLRGHGWITTGPFGLPATLPPVLEQPAARAGRSGKARAPRPVVRPAEGRDGAAGRTSGNAAASQRSQTPPGLREPGRVQGGNPGNVSGRAGGGAKGRGGGNPSQDIGRPATGRGGGRGRAQGAAPVAPASDRGGSAGGTQGSVSGRAGGGAKGRAGGNPSQDAGRSASARGGGRGGGQGAASGASASARGGGRGGAQGAASRASANDPGGSRGAGGAGRSQSQCGVPGMAWAAGQTPGGAGRANGRAGQASALACQGSGRQSSGAAYGNGQRQGRSSTRNAGGQWQGSGHRSSSATSRPTYAHGGRGG